VFRNVNDYIATLQRTNYAQANPPIRMRYFYNPSLRGYDLPLPQPGIELRDSVVSCPVIAGRLSTCDGA